MVLIRSGLHKGRVGCKGMLWQDAIRDVNLLGFEVRAQTVAL